MALGTHVTWLGDLVAERIAIAATAAIDEATKGAADDAAQTHWWQAQRGQAGLEGQIIAEPAKPGAPGEIVGRFGSSLRKDGFYGLFLERRMPFLRPAADRHFPRLPLLIRGRTKWM